MSRMIFRLLMLAIFCITTVVYYFLNSDEPVAPVFEGDIEHAQIDIQGMSRQYDIFVPDSLQADPKLLFVLHGSTQNIEKFRRFSGYTFERLAMQQGFILIYPQGFENNWNDCRATATYPAKTQNIDDIGFLHTVAEQLGKKYNVANSGRYLAGFSNGAHLGFRMALEQPNSFAAIAAISANLPTDDNNDCNRSGHPSPVVLINGTNDPINPFEGGQVTLFGFGDRGEVESSLDTAGYFAQLAGHTHNTEQPMVVDQQPLWHQTRWSGGTGPSVVHYAIIGGGHGVPNPYYAGTRLLGRNNLQIDAAELIWQFFENTP